MKINFFRIFLGVTTLCFFQNLAAQDSTVNVQPEKSHWEAGISYLNNSVYLGRQDSSKVPYITPILSYYNKCGFYISSSASYLNSGGESRIDLVEFLAGYTFTINKFEGDVSATKDFYNSQSKNVRSETQGYLDATFAYDFGFIKPSVKAGITFNPKDDYSGGFGLEHSFYALYDSLVITPSFLLNASTQNYYSLYYTKKRYSAKQKKTNGPGTTITAYLPNAAGFKIMDYEFGLPVSYTTGKFIFDFTPTLAVPVNPNIIQLTITPPSGISVMKTKTEKLNSVFYWSAGITYSF